MSHINICDGGGSTAEAAATDSTVRMRARRASLEHQRAVTVKVAAYGMVILVVREITG